MQNDSLETLLLRHYGSTAPAPTDLEQRLSAQVLRECRGDLASSIGQVVAQTRSTAQADSVLNRRRVSRRRMLQLVTFTSASAGAVAMGLNALQGTPRKHAYA